MLSLVNFPELGASHDLLAKDPSAAMVRSQDSERPSLVQRVENFVPLMVIGEKRVVLPAGVHCTDWAFHFPSKGDLVGAGFACGQAAVATIKALQRGKMVTINFIPNVLRRCFDYQPSSRVCGNQPSDAVVKVTLACGMK